MHILKFILTHIPGQLTTTRKKGLKFFPKLAPSPLNPHSQGECSPSSAPEGPPHSSWEDGPKSNRSSASGDGKAGGWRSRWGREAPQKEWRWWSAKCPTPMNGGPKEHPKPRWNWTKEGAHNEEPSPPGCTKMAQGDWNEQKFKMGIILVYPPRGILQNFPMGQVQFALSKPVKGIKPSIIQN